MSCIICMITYLLCHICTLPLVQCCKKKTYSVWSSIHPLNKKMFEWIYSLYNIYPLNTKVLFEHGHLQISQSIFISLPIYKNCAACYSPVTATVAVGTHSKLGWTLRSLYLLENKPEEYSYFCFDDKTANSSDGKVCKIIHTQHMNLYWCVPSAE